MEKIIYANGTADVLVPAGQKIAIATYGNEYATLSFKRGNNLEFIQRLDNAQVTLGPWGDVRTVRIEAAQDQVSYDVATNPSIDSNVRVNTNPLTGKIKVTSGGNSLGSAAFALSQNTVALVGSSLTDLNLTSSGLYGVDRRLDRAWMDFARAALGEKNLDVLATYAVGGNNVEQVSAQVDVALALGATWIMGDFGVINSIAGGATAAEIKTSVRNIIKKIASKGVNALFLNSTPVVAGHPQSSAATAQIQSEVNRDMAIFAEAVGVIIVDAWSATVTPTSTVGAGQATFFQADLIHYSSKGSRLIGGLVSAKLSSLIQSFPLLPSSAVTYDATNNPSSLSDNPLLIGTAGSNNTSGTITGPAPTGCTLSKAGTWGAGLGTSAVTARADGFGNDWVITVGGTVAEDDRLFMTVVPTVHTRISAGKQVFGVLSLSLTALALLKEFQINITYTKDSVSTLAMTMFEYSNENPAASEFDLSDWADRVIITPKITLPAGVYTDFRFILIPKFRAGAATATIRAGRANLYVAP